MLRYAILACLCLLASAEGDKIIPDVYRILHHKTPGSQLGKYLISPDTFKNHETYVVAQYHPLENLVKRGASTPMLQLKLTLLRDRRGQISQQCTIFLQAPPHAQELDLTSVRRVNETNVVLSWTYLGANDVGHTYVVAAYNIVNQEECKETKLALDDVLSQPIIVPTAENQFFIFINDYKYCRPADSDQCWFSYDLEKSLRKPHKFNSLIEWSTLQAERLKNGYIQIGGTSNEGTRYLMYLLVPEPEYIDMYYVNEVQYNKRNVDVVTGDMSVCWINPDHKSMVYCMQMDYHGTVIFKKKIHFKEPRTLIAVKTIRKGEIFLLTKNDHCEGVYCWHMYATIVTETSNDYKHLLMPFMCSGDDQKRLTVFDVEYIKGYQGNRTDFHYGCKWEDKFNLNSFPIYDSERI